MSVVYVHIGLPKTGTTHLQDRLWRNRDLALKHSGLLYPGNVISDHFHAAVHLQPERYLDWVDPAFDKTWPALLAQIKAWPQTSLLSHELYASATAEHIGRLVEDLSFADEVHVIATVRDLGRQLPSVWQENVKNQRQATFGEFFASVRENADGAAGAGDGAPEEPFWEFQDHVRILRTWAQFVGPERVHVVTVGRKAAPGDGLWERFLSALDVDPSQLTIPVPSLNSSLSASQTEFLRRLNSRLQPADVPWQRYERVIKGKVIGEILFESDAGRPQGLDAEQRAWAATESEAMVAQLAAAGYSVAGDLDDLVVPATATAADAACTDEQVLDVALDTLAQMVKTAPMPKVGPRARTRAANVARRVKRRAVGLLRRG